MKYFNNWSNPEDIQKDFLDCGDWDKGKRLEGFPTDEEILFASYETGNYEGDALVLFMRDGKVYQNEASHCSCYGLEDGWHPSEVLPEQLLKQRGPYEDHGEETVTAWKRVVNELNGIETPIQ
jgi:hypothetical protein